MSWLDKFKSFNSNPTITPAKEPLLQLDQLVFLYIEKNTNLVAKQATLMRR